MPDSPEISLRQAGRNQIPLLWSWYSEHVKDNFIGQIPSIVTLTADIMTGTGLKMIAYINHAPVGFVWVDVKVNKYDNQLEASLRFLHVDKHFRRMGIGKKLLQMAEDMAKKMDASYMTLGTKFQNKAARTLYNKSGYRPTRAVYRKDFK